MEKLEQFQLFQIRRGKSSGTILKHIQSLQTILKHNESLEVDNIEAFILSYLQQGKSKEYLNVIIQAVRAWGEFVGDESYKRIKYFTVNPEESHKATLSDKEIEAFLTLGPIENKNPTRASNKKLYNSFTLYFKILAYTGMRPGEAAQLKIDAVDFGRMVFDLEKTKTLIPRLVPIPPLLREELRIYIQNLPNANLFVAEDNQQITREHWKYQFKSRILRLGIKRKNLSTNSLRHSFITRFLEEDVNVKKVQMIVGHRKIETTARYEHLGTKQLQLTIKKDRLSRESLNYEERFKQFREEVRKLLGDLTLSLDEEKKMLNDLMLS